MHTELVILVVAFFFIAMIYSSVGFGGGSSYLALLGVMGVHFDVLRPAALLCNIVVVTGGTYIFWRSGAIDFKKSWPFLCASIPLAFLGGLWQIEDARFFFILLGSSLIVASVLLWIQPEPRRKAHFTNPLLNASLGGAIGFLSGFIGIGGGIFLSPVLHLMKWAEPRKISALASLFILANSISGLAGQVTQAGGLNWQFIAPLLVAVLIGGQIGSRMGARKFNPLYIKRITAIVIFAAAVKILIDNL
ncbi:MAG TPA: sulfite exporter TauE/SafE family protein [Chryseosolibacter sp.]|nr:sulfite exporter TauE/SafE family protein [Chryseosolibacter sp.]